MDNASSRIARGPDPGAWLRPPFSDLVLRPWFDDLTLRVIGDWVLPASRAQAAALVARGDPERFAAELGLAASQLPAADGFRRALLQTAEVAAAHEVAAARWREAFFGPSAPSHEERVAIETERFEAAHRQTMERLRYAWFARSRAVESCRWEVASQEEVEASHGARLADPDSAYAIGPDLPAVVTSRAVRSELGREYWLAFQTPWAPMGDTVWARVFEPVAVANPPTVILLHGICIEFDHVRGPLREIDVLARQGVRVIAVEAPWHGRRRPRGRYSGEVIVATTPMGALDHLAAHVREVAVLTAWAHGKGAAVGVHGYSLGSFTAQLAAVHAAFWPEACRPDALFLSTTADGMDSIALTGAFARAFGADVAYRSKGWTEETLRRWSPLTDPLGPPAVDLSRIFMVLGAADDVTPFNRGRAIAERWRLPPEQVAIREQGHFSVAVGLIADSAPMIAFADALKRI